VTDIACRLAALAIDLAFAKLTPKKEVIYLLQYPQPYNPPKPPVIWHNGQTW